MKDKNVAIMTWHTYDNYGSVLQAYALRNKIKELGYKNVDLINYLPRAKRIKFIKRINSKNIQRKILNSRVEIKQLSAEKKEKFNAFRNKNFTYTQKCNDATELFNLNDKYDKFICGSDQIWAPTVFDENYFLSFVSNDSKKISYAPSLGLTSIENEYTKEKIKKLVNRINAISVREEQGKKIIEKISNKNVKVVLDPTLLLDKKEWNENFNLECEEKDYIIFYCLGGNKKNYKIAKMIAKKLGKKLKVIPSDILDYQKNETQNASPEEFLKLIYNAYLVITDSFHGTIFAINFNVPFITLKRFKDNKLSQNSRIYNILKKVKLENRIYKHNENYFLENIKIDFSNCNKIMEKERRESIEFLRQALESENNSQTTNIITNICTGCGMCAAACPKKCISIELNENGFYNYIIDENKCIKCGKCKKVCGQLSMQAKNLQEMELYSGYSLDENILKTSSSGGMAYELSLLGLQHNIPVIGCSYNTEKNRAEHIIITNQKDLLKLSGSKYLQSYTREAFEELKKMDKGIVIGTPCQIASVDQYLKLTNKREQFVLIDLICHGVPSYYLWKKYINNFKNVKEVKFRDKKYGWRSMTISINSRYHKKEDRDLFYDVFRTEIAFNKSCYECKYRTKTYADIRIGDYWGPKFKDNKNGVSMICINTLNGKKMVEYLSKQKRIKLEKQPITDYYKIQQTINTMIPTLYDKIILDLKDDKIKLKNISKKYCKRKLRHGKMIKILTPVYNKLKGF